MANLSHSICSELHIFWWLNIIPCVPIYMYIYISISITATYLFICYWRSEFPYSPILVIIISAAINIDVHILFGKKFLILGVFLRNGIARPHWSLIFFEMSPVLSIEVPIPFFKKSKTSLFRKSEEGEGEDERDYCIVGFSKGRVPVLNTS